MLPEPLKDDLIAQIPEVRGSMPFRRQRCEKEIRNTKHEIRNKLGGF